MDRPTALNKIIQDFKTWLGGTGFSAAPVAWPETDLDFTNGAPTKWLRFSFQWSGSVSAGASRLEDRHTGFAMVELFWPAGEGYRDVERDAELIATFFRDYSADNGRLKTSGINDGSRPWVSSPPREPGWAKRTVNVPVRLMQAL